MEPWEDELLWDDDFSDEEEVAEEQIEETGLKMDEDSFADWEDASDGAPVDETLEEALAEERTLELESELEQDEHPRDYNAELEDEEEEAAPTSEKRLKREIRAEALRRLEEAARTESDFLTVVDEWNKLDRNRERRERDYENLRGDVPLEFQAVPDPKIAPLWMNLPRFRQLCQGNFLDIIFSCPYELHELTANRLLSKLFFTLSDEKKEVLYYLFVMFYLPDTQEAIVSQAQFDRVQELRKNKRRPVKAERQGLFSGLLFCADCGGKLHFATSRRFEGKQDRYVCCHYKSNRGTCTAHYIREDVLREIVLERIRAVNEHIRDDVDAFQEEWLQCRRTDQERSIRDDKKKVEQAKKRLSDLDVIISQLYEDYVLGNLSQDRYKKMSADYEAEQERLKLEIEVIEEWVEQREEMNDGLDAFIVLTQKYVDVEELTQTIVNEYIKKIVVYAPDKSSGKRTQKVKIYFNFVDDVDIPIISEPITTETTYGPRKTA